MLPNAACQACFRCESSRETDPNRCGYSSFFTGSRFWGFFLLNLPAVFAFTNPVILEAMQINPSYGRLLAF